MSCVNNPFQQRTHGRRRIALEVCVCPLPHLLGSEQVCADAQTVHVVVNDIPIVMVKRIVRL